MRYRIDVGNTDARVALAVCACGWRGLATSRRAALERFHSHLRTMHPEDSAQARQIRNRLSRDSSETNAHEDANGHGSTRTNPRRGRDT